MASALSPSTYRDRRSYRRAALRFGDHLPQSSAVEKVIACAAIVYVINARFVGKAHPRDELTAARVLNIHAELLLSSSLLDRLQ